MNFTSQISIFYMQGLTIIKMSFEKYFNNLSSIYKNNLKKVSNIG